MAAPRFPFVAFVVVAIFAAAGAPASAAPMPSYTMTPNPPVAGTVTTFRSTSTTTNPGGITDVRWDFAGGTGFEQIGNPTTFPYGSCGPRNVRLRVSDADGFAILAFTVNVVPGPIPPIAQFRFSPAFPLVGQEVLFNSSSYDPDGRLTRYEWDFDGDGFDDGSTAEVAHTFRSAGAKTARLRVTDNSCRSSVVATDLVTVTAPPPQANRLPVAQFAVSPLRPRVGEQVALRSFSYDTDGSIVVQRWDLDGDGDFDENVNGNSAFTTFSEAGERIVRLEVRDSSGGVQTETQNITVRSRPAAPVSLINPFPVARLAGSVYPRGVRVRLLEVRTPAGSRVVVRCVGKSCPHKKITKTSKKKPVRFEKLTRFLRAGTVLEVLIRKAGQIGKYTRWLIRGGKLPKRKDLCLYPGRSKGRPCP
jgi:PKD repeat protein